MINKIYKLILIIFLSTNCLKAYGVEQFNFDVKEITILENGNKFIGTNRGKITTNEGIEIEADRFEYIKDINLLNASDSLEMLDRLWEPIFVLSHQLFLRIPLSHIEHVYLL